MKILIPIATVLSLTVLLGGCYESTEITNFEPGVYKGAADPLLKADSGERAQTLLNRFALVQTDR